MSRYKPALHDDDVASSALFAYKINADGSVKTLLGAGVSPGWSPDGTRIAVVVGASEIHTISANGGNDQLVAGPFPAGAESPDWQPLAPPPPDTDDDGVPDAPDNCPETPNADQTDSDHDSVGDACDSDLDNDGVSNTSDNCPSVSHSGQGDADHDGVGDACDPDVDGDGVANASDNCPSTANSNQLDSDNDGIVDACDPTRYPARSEAITGTLPSSARRSEPSSESSGSGTSTAAVPRAPTPSGNALAETTNRVARGPRQDAEEAPEAQR